MTICRVIVDISLLCSILLGVIKPVSAKQLQLQPTHTQIFTVRIKNAQLRMMSHSFYVHLYQTPSTQPKPLAVILHGRAASEAARASLSTTQFTHSVRHLLKLGYVVAVPIRMGYGISTGKDIEAAGTCYKRDYAAGLQAAASQTLAAINRLRRQADIAATGTVLIGHSYGGMVALATAAKQPMGIRAVINISGGAGGNPHKHPKQPCGVRNMQQQLKRYGRTSRVPSVWIYAENDRFWGAAIPQKWLQAYRQTGGVAYFYNVGKRGADGHTLFSHFPSVWQKKAAPWLRLSK